MKIIKNVKAISTLSLILLLLAAAIIGAILSYMFVMGYYVSLGLKLPPEASVTITNATFPVQNATIFNVTVLNPSLSPSSAIVTQIEAITEGNKVNIANVLYPATPYSMKPGSIENFTCLWNWSNYNDTEVTIHVLLTDGLGATLQVRTPPMKLVANAYFNATAGTNYFNLTVQNDPSSATYVDVTGITLTTETVGEITPYPVLPVLPYALYPSNSVTFKCSWNWTYNRNETVTIAVNTLQNYEVFCSPVTPLPVTLTITKAIFNETDTDHFNVTVQNSWLSPTKANITEITVTMENRTTREINETAPLIPHILLPNSSQEFKCTWNWTLYRNNNATIKVYQLEGYPANYTQTTPPLISLNITGAFFNITDTAHFNVTVKNSNMSPMFVNVTRIDVTMENGTEQIIAGVAPRLPSTLYPSNSTTFICSWNWTNYRSKNVTITVYTLQGYRAYYTKVTPARVNLTVTAVFNTSDMTHFNATIQSSELSPIAVNIIRITVMNMTTGNETTILDMTPPYRLSIGFSVTFMCNWNWTSYQGQKVTIIVYTSEGYKAETLVPIP
jgi:hypothetical protein